MRTRVKTFFIITFVVVIAFALLACDNSATRSCPFAGTWIGTAVVEGTVVTERITADSITGTFRIFQSFASIEVETLRGTYVVSGYNVAIRITEAHAFIVGGQLGVWIPYSELPADVRQGMPQIQTVTITGNTFTHRGIVYTRQ